MRLCTFCFLLILLFTGCSRLPEPVGYDYSVQQKMQAAYHWEVLANDVANQINNELIRGGFITTPVFVKETCGSDTEPCKADETPTFNESFRDLLITGLVKLGVPTTTANDDNNLVINYKTQLIYHAANRMRTAKPGNITALTTGIMVLRNAPSALFGIGLAGAADLVNSSFVHSGHYEVVVTTSIVDHSEYIFRQSDIYYINDRDLWHYAKDESEASNLEMTKRYFSKGSLQNHEEEPQGVSEISVEESSEGSEAQAE